MPIATRYVLPVAFVLFLGLNFAFLTYTRPSALNSVITLNQQLPDSILNVHLSSDNVAEVAPIVFALVMFGASSATEGLLALKSALMHVSRPTEFHIICSQDAVPIIQEKLDLFSRPAYHVDVRFYPLSDDLIKARTTRAGVDTVYSAGLGGLVKVFIHELLYDVGKVIFYDTDMLFLVDPALLWREFDQMHDRQMIAFPTLGAESGSGEICTCVMLLNLKAMRTANFMPSTLFLASHTPSVSPPAWRATGIDPLKPQFGDQGLYWAVWKHRPEFFMHLGLSWDMTHCRYSYGLSLADGNDSMSEAEQIDHQFDTRTAPERFNQLFPGIVHFNCQPDFPVVWTEPKNAQRPRWGPFVTIAMQYKWVWLNRGLGDAHVVSQTVVRQEGEWWWDQISTSRTTPGAGRLSKRHATHPHHSH
ncbi:glycosyltransferase family 8 protein [Neolentinus lepideus HHB14362 ss-1]|uniref:Glycosyltransferase family 8 protein n=1 Tax=Neolentinus lepideus HHB14362 ss-1 TaxID=1314782 RepID=A0A165TWR8_9AGAM|nr:glycosyltransferase family 8 protein [Neolentinus lepideus HHB14362 ss-1]